MSKSPPAFSHCLSCLLSVDFGAFKAVEEIGAEIRDLKNLQGIVVVSAHWESPDDKIYVNTEEHTQIIHDFDIDRWPSFMFEEKYANVGSKQIANLTIIILKANGIKTVRKSRGLDHGAWVPFKIAFPPEKFPLGVPIVQISLYHDENPKLHVKLSKALGELRQYGIVIIGSGMSVHNLDQRDDYPDGVVANFTIPFDNAVVDALTNKIGAMREKALLGLLDREDFRSAHPTLEHFYPIFVTGLSAIDEPCEMFYTSYGGSFAWGQYRCGQIHRIDIK